MVALIEVGNVFSSVDSADEMCRLAVKLGRSRLGFDRLCIWFRQEGTDWITGSFGTDERGRVRDERGLRIRVRDPRLKHAVRSLKAPNLFQQEGPLCNHKGEIVGRGAWCCSALWAGEKSVGYMMADNLLTGRPLNTKLLALFAATFGHLYFMQSLQCELRKSEERYREMWENAPVGYHTLDRRGVITKVNSTEAAMLGYKVSELVGRPIFDLIVPEQREESRRRFRQKIAGHTLPKATNRTYIRRDGTPVVVSIEDRLEHDGDGCVTGVRTTMMDITEQWKARRIIEQFAYADTLTGLPNRRLFEERLTGCLERCRRKKGKFAVMLMDIDGFKQVNDTWGHGTGDRLLKHVGSKLLQILRTDDTVARAGGDEFLIMLPRVGKRRDACTVAHKIVDATAEPFYVEGNRISATVSIGISTYPRDGKNSRKLLERADAAMYAAKRAGKCRWMSYAETVNSRRLSAARGAMENAGDAAAAEAFVPQPPSYRI